MPRPKTTEQLALARCTEAIVRLQAEACDILDLLQLAQANGEQVCGLARSFDQAIRDAHDVCKATLVLSTP